MDNWQGIFFIAPPEGGPKFLRSFWYGVYIWLVFTVVSGLWALLTQGFWSVVAVQMFGYRPFPSGFLLWWDLELIFVLGFAAMVFRVDVLALAAARAGRFGRNLALFVLFLFVVFVIHAIVANGLSWLLFGVFLQTDRTDSLLAGTRVGLWLMLPLMLFVALSKNEQGRLIFREFVRRYRWKVSLIMGGSMAVVVASALLLR